MPATTEAGTAYIRFKGDFSEVNRQLRDLGKSYRSVGTDARSSSRDSVQAENQRQSAIQNSNKQLNVLHSAMRRQGDDTDVVHKKTELLGGSLFRTNARLSLFSKTIALMKWPVMIAGAGLAARALGALGASTIGLTGALAPLSGLLASYPILLSAFGQAAGVVALS